MGYSFIILKILTMYCLAYNQGLNLIDDSQEGMTFVKYLFRILSFILLIIGLNSNVFGSGNQYNIDKFVKENTTNSNKNCYSKGEYNRLITSYECGNFLWKNNKDKMHIDRVLDRKWLMYLPIQHFIIIPEKITKMRNYNENDSVKRIKFQADKKAKPKISLLDRQSVFTSVKTS